MNYLIFWERIIIIMNYFKRNLHKLKIESILKNVLINL